MTSNRQNYNNCRHCRSKLNRVFVDLGVTPVSNDYLRHGDLDRGEPFYPLRAYICENCFLVQLNDFHKDEDLFREDYAYFSSISSSWVEHSKSYTEQMISRFNLNEESTIIEVASNDGYLLQFFRHYGSRVLGIEPCKSVAEFASNTKGIPTLIEFFSEKTSQRLKTQGFSADLTIANNVLAHVPDINDFVSGFREILKPDGVSTFEFPHVLNLIRECQFDTIYHEHFSYLSLIFAERLFSANGLKVFDVEQLPTHGGSLRLYVCRSDATWDRTERVDKILNMERDEGLENPIYYEDFAERVRESKRSLLEILINLKRSGKTIVGYGAPAKGNTLLNYCGIGSDFLEFTVDRSPQKQGLFLPGSRLEIKSPEDINLLKPDFILILPWNIKEEIIEQMKHVKEWGCRFIVPMPRPVIF